MKQFCPSVLDKDYFHSLFLAQKVLQAATHDWQSDHGAATSLPAKGTTRSTGRTDANWKNIDDAATAYSSSPITAGQNSFEIFLFSKFTGTFNQILNGKFAHTATAFGSNLTLKGIPSAPNVYIFTITSGNATAGATYTNNSQTFTVLETIASQVTLVTSGTGAPAASGTLTKATGTGDSTITFSTSGRSGLSYTTPSTTANANLSTDMTSAIAIGSGVDVWYGPTGPEASGKATSSTNATTYSTYLTTQLQTGGSAAAGDTAQVTLTHQYLEN
jgi:hypothetical protein